MEPGCSAEIGGLASQSYFSRLGGSTRIGGNTKWLIWSIKVSAVLHTTAVAWSFGRPVGGYDFDTLADDLKAVIEHLDLRDITLVGQSMGCGEMVRYLTMHKGARVARVAMVAPITPLIMKTADNPDGIDGQLSRESA
jgi:pimeloyl-ACP methyl ester carboxylesterase